MGRKQKINPDCRDGKVPCRRSGGWTCSKLCRRCRGSGWVTCPACNGASCRERRS